MNVILPYLCKSIIEGVKRYEYRKAIFKCSDISKVYMYATDSICKVIGYFTLEWYNMWHAFQNMGIYP